MSFEDLEEAFIWSCDECGRVVGFKPDDFWACVAELKSRGWGFERSEGTWLHYCPKHRPRLAQVLKMKARDVG